MPADPRSGAGWSEAGNAAPAAPPEGVPADRYVPDHVLGEGGMGVVTAALDRRLDRFVALKELKADAPPGADERMRREAWITARLDHPGIVPIFDVGTTADGRPCYTMRLVRGRSLAEALAGASLDERLALVRHVLDASHAVAYAHALGVVHRDLKPANVMVGAFGETQVVDWGLARLKGEPHAPASGSGTPGYTSPEQRRGDEADARSDVWSLGAILATVLTGSAPDGRPLREAAPAAPVELVAVAERALRPLPDGRYPDAGALAADLERWFAGRRVSAYEYSSRELLGRLVRAWRAPLAVGAVAGALLLGTGAWALWETRAARLASDRHLQAALVQQAIDAAARGDRPEAEVLASWALTLGPSPDARGVLASWDADRPRLLATVPLAGCDRPASDGVVVLCFGEGEARLHEVGGERRWTVPTQAGRGLPLPDGGAILGSDDGLVRVDREGRPSEIGGALPGLQQLALGDGRAWARSWEQIATIDLASGAVEIRPACGGASRAITAVADRDRLVVACQDGRLVAYGPEPSAVATLPEAPAQLAIVNVPWSSEPAIATASSRGALGLVGQRGRDTGAGHAAPLVTIGERVAIAGVRGDVRVVRPDTGASFALPRGARPLAATPEGHLLAISGDELQTWALPAADPAGWPGGSGVTAVRVAPGGDRLAIARGDGTVTMFDGGRLPVASLKWQGGVLKDADFGPDGAFVATGVEAPGTRVFTASGEPAGDEIPFRRVAALADGWFLGLAWAGPSALWRPGGERLEVAPTDLVDVSRPPDGAWAVALDAAGGIFRIAPAPLEVTSLGKVDGGLAAAVAADGRVAIATETTLEILGRGPVAAAPTRTLDLAFSPDGSLLAAGGLDGLAYVWRASDGALLATLRGHEERVSTVAFTPDGAALYTGGWDGHVRRWSLRDLEVPADRLEADAREAWRLDRERVLSTAP